MFINRKKTQLLVSFFCMRGNVSNVVIFNYGSAVGGTSGRYDEHFGFDKMGNYSGLLRIENGSMINNLSFAYTGNQLKKVDNAVSPYIPYGSEAFNDKQKIDTDIPVRPKW